MFRYTNLHRFTLYYKSNGPVKTLYRMLTVLLRTVWKEKLILFCVNLTDLKDPTVSLPSNLKIDCKLSKKNFSAEDLESLSDIRGGYLLNHQLKERFDKGSSMWLAKMNNEITAFGWSLGKQSVKPYFLPLTNKDVHLFDFEVVPKFRGKGINPALVNYILLEMKKRRFDRAFIETSITNKFEICSLSKTYFQKLGIARQLSILGRNIVIWYELSKDN